MLSTQDIEKLIPHRGSMRLVDEIADILYQTVVAHAHVAQGGTLDARVLEKAFAHFNLFLKLTNADVTIK